MQLKIIKMKKYIYTSVVLLFALLCEAQSPVYDITTLQEKGAGVYYKDLNNLFNGYDGMFGYYDANTTMEIVLQKIAKSYQNGYHYEDIIVGELRFVKNGIEYINTLAEIDDKYDHFYSDNFSHMRHVIKGASVYKGRGVWCKDCLPTDKTLRFYFRDPESKLPAILHMRLTIVNSATVLLVDITDGGSFTSKWDHDYPRPRIAIDYGSFKMNRVYGNNPIVKPFVRNNCAVGGKAFGNQYELPYGKYQSTISQVDADNKALADINTIGQNYANTYGVCEFKNQQIIKEFTKNNCPSTIGGKVFYTVSAGKYTSYTSQEDANSKAQIEVNSNGQTNANNLGTCGFLSRPISSVSFRKNNCRTGTGSLVTYSARDGAFTSNISQLDADSKARDAGQENANRLGTCSGGSSGGFIGKNPVLTR
jgi:hypothetical protein